MLLKAVEFYGLISLGVLPALILIEVCYLYRRFHEKRKETPASQ